MSCGLWLKNLGCRPIIIERDADLGGALRLNYLRNNWVLGQENIIGTALAERFANHIRSENVPCFLAALPTKIMRERAGFRIFIDSFGELVSFDVDSVVIAVGTRYRHTEVVDTLPGLLSLPSDRLIFGPHAFDDLAQFSGKSVAVVGGGDNAYEFITIVEPFAKSLSLVMRSTPRAQQNQQDHINKLAATQRCAVFQQTSFESIEWWNGKIKLSLYTRGKRKVFYADYLVVQAGYVVNSDSILSSFDHSLVKEIQLDDDGYLIVDNFRRTSCNGIYAIGDVENRDNPSVVTALAAGAVAARTIETDFR